MNAPPKTLGHHVRSLNATPTGSVQEQWQKNSNAHKIPRLKPANNSTARPQTKLPSVKAKTKTLRKRPPVDIEKTPESLPVLQAFQEFLDAERRGMRNRMLTLTAFFVAVLITIAASSLFVGMLFMGQIEDDVCDIQQDFIAFRTTSQKTKNDANLALSRFTRDTTKLRNEIIREKQAVVEARSQINSRINSYDSELEEIKEVINMLESENTSLKTELGSMKEKWVSMAGNIATPTLKKSYQRPGPPTSDTSESIFSKSVSIAMSILPRGGNHAVKWRLPIPE